MASAAEPPLPTNVAHFNSDDRISYSKLDGKYLAVLDDGTELEFDERTRTWVADDEDQNEFDAYSAPRDDEYPYQDTSRKRKHGPSAGNEGRSDEGASGNSNSNSRGRPAKKSKPPPPPKQNTAVYVTGLPLDATFEEVHELFSRKCGVIAEEIDGHKPRIKMYADETGNFKGDALIVFFKPQSVDMAIMLLDDTEFRFNTSGASSGRMRVQAADASYKKMNYDQGAGVEGGSGAKAEGNGTSGGGSAAAAKRGGSDRHKIIKKTQKLESKLADWSDEDEYYPAARPTNSKWDKTVILEHMFTLEELEEDPAALLEIKEDIREECAKLGTVTNVVLFDLEPDGIVSIKFKEGEAAEACVRKMHGRSFDGRVVQAFIATGKERFRKSRKEQGGGDDSDDE